MQHVHRRETLIDMHTTVKHMWRHVENRYAGRGLHHIWRLRSLRRERARRKLTRVASVQASPDHPGARRSGLLIVPRNLVQLVHCSWRLRDSDAAAAALTLDARWTVDAADMGTRW